MKNQEKRTWLKDNPTTYLQTPKIPAGLYSPSSTSVNATDLQKLVFYMKPKTGSHIEFLRIGLIHSFQLREFGDSCSRSLHLDEPNQESLRIQAKPC